MLFIIVFVVVYLVVDNGNGVVVLFYDVVEFRFIGDLSKVVLWDGSFFVNLGRIGFMFCRIEEGKILGFRSFLVVFLVSGNSFCNDIEVEVSIRGRGLSGIEFIR